MKYKVHLSGGETIESNSAADVAKQIRNVWPKPPTNMMRYGWAGKGAPGTWGPGGVPISEATLREGLTHSAGFVLSVYLGGWPRFGWGYPAGYAINYERAAVKYYEE